jgi:hypothetical protein
LIPFRLKNCSQQSRASITLAEMQHYRAKKAREVTRPLSS